ncbi:hypothetical protein [Polynucleobacter sp. MWH-Berg-3C6]|uniref:hypothetical protein n=1 Tax=Polynucleobacter sp. MWH-Berg-3C6 TaxID=1855882 RepID=UPI001C0D6FCE|nr:hypothetical protein [Polynucleobacter sp. MWH-Berg-3C6]MBU3551346.1 hypothetical protein [Polynucleobacter sp. MWH-Berg-3C6]
MPKDEIGEYAQKLLDRVIALTQEVDNLRTAYRIMRDRLDANAQELFIMEKRFSNEAKLVEQFAALSTKAASLTEDMARLTKNEALIQCSATSHETAKDLDEMIAKFKQGHRDTK